MAGLVPAIFVSGHGQDGGTSQSGPFSLLLAEIALYSAPSHTETWLIRPSGGSRAVKARLLTRFRRNQPENQNYGAT